MKVWIDALPYFSRQELACKGSGLIQLDIRFAVALPALRQAWDRALTPTSVCRTPSYNRIINNGRGGHPNSLHLTINPKHPVAGTMAADLFWADWGPQTQLDFARLAYRMGWSIGLHDTFVHIDLRKAFMPQGIFLYGSEWSAPFDREDIL